MRPRQSSLGILGMGPWMRKFLEASMRPRQSSLGISHPGLDHPPRSHASMRPRQSSLGIYQRSSPASGQPRQGFNEAEAIKPRNPSRRVLSHHLEVRFNEAEAIKPRNHDAAILGKLINMASMRPRQSSLGIPPGGRAQHGAEPVASMRPRQSSLGIPCLKRPSWALVPLQ